MTRDEIEGHIASAVCYDRDTAEAILPSREPDLSKPEIVLTPDEMDILDDDLNGPSEDDLEDEQDCLDIFS